MLSAQWELTYDTSKLRLASSLDDAMPYAADDAVVKENTKGLIKGNFSVLSTLDYKRRKDFVRLTFDIIGTGETTVNLNLINLGVKNSGKTGYVVDHSVDQKLANQADFKQSVTSTLSLAIPNGAKDRRLGDVNFDGKVNVADATLVQMEAAEKVLFNSDQREMGDVSKDKSVDITDATLIQRIAAQ